MDYLLKASLLIAIFYLCYKILLEKETFFRGNRWFLLLGLLTSMILPLIVIPNYIEYVPQNNLLLNLENYQTTSNQVEASSLDIMELLTTVYFIGLFGFLGRFCIQLLSLNNRFSASKRVGKHNHIHLMETEENLTPFSFFNRVVYNPNQFSEEELNLIIKHEIAHAKDGHSFDLLFAHVVSIVLWFNPFVWMYKKAIKQNLEFIADSNTQEELSCEATYQTTILKACIGQNQLSITNNFSNSSKSLRLFRKTFTFGKPLAQIKKRIVMLQSSKSNSMHQLKFLIIFPLIGLFMMSFSKEDVYIPIEDTAAFVQDTTEQWNVLKFTVNKTTTDDQLEDIKKRFNEKEAKVSFKDISRNENGYIISIAIDFKTGRSKGNFATDHEGPIKDIVLEYDVENETLSIHNVAHDMSQTIKTGKSRVKIQHNPDSIKQNVQIRKPSDETHTNYSYRVSTDDDELIDIQGKGKSSSYFQKSKDKPLIILNGDVISYEEMETLDPEFIQSVFVLKDDKAIKGYGEKGKNGVIIVDTKESKKKSENWKMGYSVHSLEQDNITEPMADPIYIVDGSLMGKFSAQTFDPKNIKSMQVIKGDKALEKYGEKAKNGVIEIITKTKGLGVRSDVSEVVAIEYTDEKKSSLEYVINEDTQDARLEILEKEFELKNMDLKFSKVRRNKDGQITSIKISLDDNDGKKSSASFKEKDATIPDIVIGKKGDELFIRGLN